MSTLKEAEFTAVVQIKLPCYWLRIHRSGSLRLRPSLPHVESHYIVSLLAPEITTEVQDLILQPPDETPYDRLKQQLIQHTATSEQKCLQQIFHVNELGVENRRSFYEECSSFWETKPGKQTTSSSFMEHLPANVRMVPPRPPTQEALKR